MCIRQSSSGSLGDLLLEPTTQDNVELTQIVAFLEKDSQGNFYLNVVRPIVLRHKAEEDVPVPVGFYLIKSDVGWGVAPLTGLCHDG